MALKKRDDELVLVPPSLAQQAGQAVRAVGDVASAPFRTSANILTEAAAAVPPAARAAGAALGAGVRDFTQGFTGAPAVTPPPALTSARNPAVPVLATAAPAPVPNFAGVNAGATAQSTPALSETGRQLGYGATVNGVRTFSDGTGGSIPATVAPSNLATLAQGRSLGRADAGIGGAIGTEAYGGAAPVGAFTGRVGEVARPVAADPYARAQADNATAQRNAASDIASVLNRDPRSVAGTAARNADVEASSTGDAVTRDKSVNALLQGAVANLDPQAKLGAAALEDAGSTNRANIAANASIIGDISRNRPTPTQVPLADGSLGLLGPDGIVRPAMDASGQPVKPREGKAVVDQGAYGKFLESATNRFLGADPLTGKITDAATGKQRDPSPEETLKAIRAARAAADEAFGQGGTGKGESAKPTKQQFMAQARSANPGVSDTDLEAYYTKTYGG